MALGDLKIPSLTVEVGQGSFDVYGLGLSSVSALVQAHLTELETIYEAVVGLSENKAADDEAVMNLITVLASEMPQLVANVIMLGAKETSEEAQQNAAALPLPVQIDAVMKIYKLTFEDVGGLKKLFEMLTPAMQKAATEKVSTTSSTKKPKAA